MVGNGDATTYLLVVPQGEDGSFYTHYLGSNMLGMLYLKVCQVLYTLLGGTSVLQHYKKFSYYIPDTDTVMPNLLLYGFHPMGWS